MSRFRCGLGLLVLAACLLLSAPASAAGPVTVSTPMGAFFNDPVFQEVERAMDQALGDLGPLMPSALSPSRMIPSHPVLNIDTHPLLPSRPRAATALHPVDIIEREKAYEVIVDAPGVQPDDIKVELQDNILSISGRRRATHEEKDPAGRVWRSERSYAFSRSLVLPEDAKRAPEELNALLDHGVLKVVVPKAEDQPPKPEPKRITVQQVAPSASST